MPLIELIDISKSYDGELVLDEFNLKIKENEFITGYMNEPWHYRYVGVEIATKMKNENISSYEEYYFMYLDK